MSALDKSLRRNRLVFGACVVVVLVVVVGLVGYNLWRLRVATIESQLDAVAQNAGAFEEHLTQTLSVIDLNLVSLAEQSAQDAALQALLRNARYLRSISVVGSGGKIISSSEPRNVGLAFNGAGFLPASTSAFPALRVGPLTGGRDLFNAKGIAVGEQAPAQSFIAVQRDVPLASGTLVTLVAVINPDYFLNYYDRQIGGSDVQVQLLRADGGLLLSTAESYLPGQAADMQLIALLAKSESGRVQQLGSSAAMEHLTGYRASRFFPVVLVVHTDTGHALAMWHREVRNTLLFTLGALGLVLGVALFFFRRFQRLAAERAVWIQALDTQKYALDQHAIVSRTDADGIITYANDKFCLISGYSRDELLGQSHRLIESDHHPEQLFSQLWETIASGQVWHGELCNRCKTGELYWVNATIVPLRGPDGFVKEYIGIRTDITDRKKIESSLEVAKLAAEQANVSKSQFLANMSHEIRTPMNAILGMLTLLQRAQLTHKQKDFAEKAEGAARSLLGLLNSILDFSKIEAGKMELDTRTFEVAQLQRDVNVILSSSVATKPVRLSFVVDPAVPTHLLGDDMRLQQILVNLGGNAIKFTEQGDVSVQVRMVVDSAGGERVEFSVRDSGIGIAPQYMAHIFDGFTQAESSITRRFGGTGLGLAICQKLVRMMGSELHVISKLGEGSCFYFAVALPEVRTQPPKVVQEDMLDKPQRLTGMRILLVEDNKINQVVAKGLLSQEGAEITIAENGALGVQAVANATLAFDAVLMDLQMPVMDGLQATRSIRQDLGIANLPIIAMTANVMQADRDACFAVGMNEHIGKPFELDHLVGVLQRFAGQIAPAIATSITAVASAVTQQQFEPGDLDEGGALARVGGDAELYATVLQAFEAEMLSALEQLRTHLHTDALDLAKRAMHTLKGLAATVGARHLSSVAFQLELALKAGVAPDDHDGLVDQLQLATDALSVRLVPLRVRYQSSSANTSSVSAIAPIDKAQLQSDLQALCRLLDGSNMLAVNAHAQIQKSHGTQLGADTEPLRHAMGRIDFVSARAACDVLLAKHCG
ncbi:MAG: hypothetical protein RL682_2048 [Pseudomonadota bacterium]